MNSSESALHYVKPTVHAAAPVQRMSIPSGFARLQWNENPLDFPPDLKEEVLQRMVARPWANYPDGLRPVALIDRLADHWDVTPEMVVVSSGSSSLIKIILSSVLSAGDHMAMPSPTFLLYRRDAALLGAQLHEIASAPAEDFALPVDELIVSARTNEAKLIALCAPNNPTGTVYSAAALGRIADESGALLLVDEAYGEYCGQNLRGLLDDFDNVILLRTFSKAYAMAGQRVGYVLTSPKLAAELDKNVNSFPISTFSETMALVALEHSHRFLDNVAATISQRERLSARLREIPGIHVFSSGTNFILMRAAAADRIAAALRDEERILVNNMAAYPELPNTLRISIGHPAQNDAVVRTIHNVMGQKP